MTVENEKQLDNEQAQIKAERHKARQQKVKAGVDAKIAAAQEEKGILLVLTGNGKGKSTSGFGTVARAVGHGKKAAVVQFIKGTWECGERNLLEGAGVAFHVMGTGFTWETQDREKDTAAALVAWEAAEALLQDESIDCLMLDELTYMVSYHYLDVERVLTALKNRPPMQHVIITGRACHRAIIELADTVSEVQPIKHAFEAGIKAQPGFDY
ncbi:MULTISPECIES: cob(I)yrinic acid a,c-diamide adenosyltransferase [Shewanella]|uniref:Corrinoid adenosyltransferase n=1 Tax=Shewanella mangrovisoli TaxID=2864211 RepID=A0ABV4VJN8_9GAMM|nr:MULTISPECIES: cob(I)yrinic acid a,c-diamide adenosyltransferase [Shewanella]ABK49498.1 cob(I)yrinic acid a,c-diamide adenosyltransferase [Shewanella sp. ANA-3]MDH1471549.1 cob(I)yrinic acid a,c-diamide adenosyltransferase [Shewanella sp. GD03713]QYJ70622.1 cob(I)yrinic acid a,c-diamide adenosyltransferase [Shewanella sp. FJAT-51649]QYK08380.1 cob(I)yrinic acid a,c-diamide adenosyltransferase [Shewanella mangrovisoli]